MKLPKITIITACFNSESTIERAINSLVNQSYKSIEYIVIDGGSTDRTMEIVNKYRGLIDICISEPDSGIADAWNKGISHASGDIIGFLNADDLYSYDTLEKVANYYKDDSSSILYGECIFVDDGEIISLNKKYFEINSLKSGFGFVHTTCFVPADIYRKVGGFDTSYKIAIDTDFLIRCCNKNVQFVKGDHSVYMYLGGVSDSYSKRAYFEFCDSLFKHNVINISERFRKKIIYSCYHPFRKLIKSRYINRCLRVLKHKSVSFRNFMFKIIPTMALKIHYLRLLGFDIGDRSFILKDSKFYGNGNFTIGNNSIVNRCCLLDNRGSIKIGDNVSISHNVKIYTGGHNIDSSFFEYFQSDVVIENDVCIFSNVIIQPGVCISKGSVILPGSVVTKDVEEYSVYGGNPAVKIKNRNRSLYYKFNYPYWDAM
ncbi:glycosyltransferase [Shewanella oncorhynchi]|uniref:glycosyltransferase n=1 Tax=Shewanella TaxID=22 RepID=UPI00217D7BBA|nr:glycosyltransferase [Shewanella baltica]MCS6153488.1 glycosyltransferase [Shewanella baltica]